MKTTTRDVGVYRHVRSGISIAGEAERYKHDNDYILTSNIVNVKFEVVDILAENDAMKAIRIKLAQERLEVAQKDLEDLL